MKKKIDQFKNRASFTVKDARSKGVSARMLNYYRKKGEIERIGPGVYSSTRYISSLPDGDWEEVAIAAQNIKGGVICLTSALVYYDITDEIMRDIWIAVDNSNSNAKFPMTKIVRMRNTTLGVKEIEMAGMKVKIFDVERTIIDSFRFLSFETAMKALKIYLSGELGRPDIRKMSMYARKLRASKIINYIRTITS